MRYLIRIIVLLCITPVVWANELPKMVLDKVSFQITQRQWVTTQTALLSINVNITLKTPDLVKARQELMTSLNKIAKADWHVLQFDRSQDSSGLEKLYVQAQARIDQSFLTNIYDQAKSVSAPGAKYEVGGVEFKPSLEEIQGIRTQLREQLYQKVNDEMTRINKAYPNQNYSVNNLVFAEGDGPIQPKAYMAKDMNVTALVASSPPPVVVSNELIMTAFVEAASNRN